MESRNFIKEFWDGNAEKFQDSHWVSWGDNWMIDLELENIREHIKDNNKVLDIGCSNGFGAIFQAESHKIEIIGVDYSEKMIEQANRKYGNNEVNATFKVADILDLPFEDNTFDITYTTRVLINLPTWEQQKQAIDECVRVTKKGGLILFSEAFWEPLMLLNAMRSLVSLPSLVEHDFNRYIKKQKLQEYLDNKSYKYTYNDFSSIYYLGSRFLRDIVTNPEDYEGYSNPINEIFHGIQKNFSGGNFGVQQSYLIEK